MFKRAVSILMLISVTSIPLSRASERDYSTTSQPSATHHHQLYGLSLGNYDLYTLSQSPNSHDHQSLTLYNTRNGSTSRIPLPSSKRFFTATASPDNDTVYLAGSGDGDKTTTVSYLNVRTGDFADLLTLSDTSLTELQYFGGSLYWIGNRTDIVGIDLDGGERRPRVLLKAPYGVMLMGLAVDRRDGTLFYTTWPRRQSPAPTISRLNPTHNQNSSFSNTSVLSADELLPRTLYHSQSTLYYVSSPPGHHFHIKSLDTEQSSGSEHHEELLHQPHKSCTSLAVTCNGTVFWTDRVNRRLWRVVSDKGGSWSSLDEAVGKGVLSVFGRECKWDELVRMEQMEEKEVVEVPEVDAPSSAAGAPVAASMNLVEQRVETGSDSAAATEQPTDQAPAKAPIRLCSAQEAEAIGCHHICVFSLTPTCLLSSQPTTKPAIVRTGPIIPSSRSSNALQSSSPPQDSSSSDKYSWPPFMIALVSVLATVSVLMTLTSLYMGLRVRSLSKKPVIRRRVVVSRSQSESQGGGHTNPTSVCEMIDIENCCNMNVCETPCYERTLLQPTSSSSSSTSGSTVISVNDSSSTSIWGPCTTTTSTSSKKEDKRCLLGR